MLLDTTYESATLKVFDDGHFYVLLKMVLSVFAMTLKTMKLVLPDMISSSRDE